MSTDQNTFHCSFVSVDYIVCECGETFPSEDDLRVHLEKVHPHKKERKEYKCGVCHEIYATEQECVDHYENTHLEVKNEHNYVADPDTEDNEDQTEIVSSDNEAQQMYGLNMEPLLVYDDDYGSLNNVARVVEVNKNVQKRAKRQRKPKSDDVKVKKTVTCDTCGKTYYSKAALSYHQHVHTGKRPYKCSYCPKTFTTSVFLKIHTRTHTGERPYKCPLCPKAFSNQTALLRHDRVHTGVKPYPCPHCGKAFSQSNSMKLHVNTVHFKMPAPYKSQKRRLKELVKEGCVIEKDEYFNGRNKDKYIRGSVMEENDTNNSVTTFVNDKSLTRFVNDKSVNRFVNESVSKLVKAKGVKIIGIDESVPRFVNDKIVKIIGHDKSATRLISDKKVKIIGNEKIVNDKSVKTIGNEKIVTKFVNDKSVSFVNENYVTVNGNVEIDCVQESMKEDSDEQIIKGEYVEEESVEEECVRGTMDVDDGNNQAQDFFISDNDNMELSEEIVYFEDDEDVTYNLVYE